MFGTMRGLHELLWYLTEAVTIRAAAPLHDEIARLRDEVAEVRRRVRDRLRRSWSASCSDG